MGLRGDLDELSRALRALQERVTRDLDAAENLRHEVDVLDPDFHAVRHRLADLLNWIGVTLAVIGAAEPEGDLESPWDRLSELIKATDVLVRKGLTRYGDLEEGLRDPQLTPHLADLSSHPAHWKLLAIQKQSEELSAALEKLASAGMDVLPRSAILTGVGAELSALSAQASARRIKQTEHEVASAAGVVGSGSLALAFAGYSASQTRAARAWMVFALLAVVTVAGVGVLLLAQGASSSWQGTLAHLVIALPAAGVAAYGGRESSRHRESAQWAKRLSAQLATLGPYAERLSAANSEELWMRFGTYVFGPSVAADASSENQLSTIPPELLTAIATLAAKAK